MRPPVFATAASIPLTHNGKVDRTALLGRGDRSPHSRAPLQRNAIELLLTQAWTEFLGSTPDPDHGFFTTGGDSISALQLRAAIERRGLKLNLNDLFTNPTIAGLATALS